jgi:release factor glutamine methyltransferase
VAEGPTWRDLVVEAGAAGLEDQEARWLAEHVSGEAAPEGRVPDRLAERFRVLLARRMAGEPLQYVLGAWAFRQLDLLVDRRVLIPRPETEWVVEQALGVLPEGDAIVVDLGTGSGAIALSIAWERWPDVRVVATDASADAVAVARANLAGLGRRGTGVELHQGSWWDAVPGDLRGAIDLVVSNPPYVAPSEQLPPEVRDWEPLDALVPGPTGLEALEVILGGAAAWLAPGGWVVCEIGEAQGAAVTALAETAGLADVEIRPDLTGRDRMVVAQRPAPASEA